MKNLFSTVVMVALFFIASISYGQGLENFNNYPETGNAYHDGEFQGQDGSTWFYYQCRGDSVIVAPSPTLGKNRVPVGEVKSGSISNGCGTLSFDYKQVFTSTVSMEVYVNSILVYTATTAAGEQGIVKHTGPIEVNQSGKFIMDFKQQSTSSGQVTIDNVSWTAYNSAPLPEPTNYPTDFSAVASPYTINLSWVDATGGQLPSKYLLLASTSPDIQAPVDGNQVADDPNLADGSGALNIAQGVQMSLFTNLPSNLPYYFKIFPYTNAGSDINYKTDGTAPYATAITPNVTVMNSENFNDGTFGTWHKMTVLGDTAFAIDMTHGVDGTPCAKASGFFGGASHQTELWLLSTPINFDLFSGETLTFKTAKNYAGPDLEVKISNDYDGVGNPNNFTWTDLQATWSAGGWTWTSSGNVDVSGIAGQDVYIGFKYTSTDTESSTWEVDDIVVMGVSSVGPLPEPTNYPTSFAATGLPYTISLTWVDATGGQVPTAYLVKASASDNITAPVDGVPVPDDANLADGSGVLNITAGTRLCHFTDLPVNTPYYFKIYPYTNAGIDIDYKTDGTVPAATATTPNVAVINSENFNSGTFGTWTEIRVSGETNWFIDATHGVGGTPCAKATGYSGGASHAAELWLVSPSMNFDNYAGEILSFQNAKSYTGPVMEILISANYTSGDPTTATWIPLTANLSTGSFTWTPSGNVDVSATNGENVHIAFKYISTDSESATWEVDDIVISGAALGLQENELNKGFSVIPNPSDGHFRLLFSDNTDRTVRIISMLGTEVYRSTSNQKDLSVNLPDLAAGIYFVQVTRSGNEKPEIVKLVVR